MSDSDKISHDKKALNQGHRWESVAIFTWDAVNDHELQNHPLLYVKCTECPDERVLIGSFLTKG